VKPFKYDYMGKPCFDRKEVGLRLRCLGVYNRFSLRTEPSSSGRGDYCQYLMIKEGSGNSPFVSDRQAVIDAFSSYGLSVGFATDD